MFSALYNIFNSIFFRDNSIENIKNENIEDNKKDKIYNIKTDDIKTNDIKTNDIKTNEEKFEEMYETINERKKYFLKNGVIKNQISYVPYKFKENIVELKKIFNIKRFEFIMTIDEEDELEKEREFYINNNVKIIRDCNIIKVPENLLDKEDYICAIFYADDSYLL
jgi:hypothetical protein